MKTKRKFARIRTMQGVLNEINRFYDDSSVANAEHWKLWNVLTALRGPDNVDQETKSDTTAVIRAVALPAAKGYAQFNFNSKVVKVRNEYTHFRAHIRRAALTLGIKIDER